VLVNILTRSMYADDTGLTFHKQMVKMSHVKVAINVTQIKRQHVLKTTNDRNKSL